MKKKSKKRLLVRGFVMPKSHWVVQDPLTGLHIQVVNPYDEAVYFDLFKLISKRKKR